MDIFPTILDLLNIDNPGFLGNTFTGEILKKTDKLNTEENLNLMIQPYNGGFLSFVRYPHKYTFDIYQNKLFTYNLKNDFRSKP